MHAPIHSLNIEDEPQVCSCRLTRSKPKCHLVLLAESKDLAEKKRSTSLVPYERQEVIRSDTSPWRDISPPGDDWRLTDYWEALKGETLLPPSGFALTLRLACSSLLRWWDLPPVTGSHHWDLWWVTCRDSANLDSVTSLFHVHSESIMEIKTFLELQFHISSLGETVSKEDLCIVLFFLYVSLLTVLSIWPLTPLQVIRTPTDSIQRYNGLQANPWCRSSKMEFYVTTVADVSHTSDCSSCFLPRVQERLLHFQIQHYLLHQGQITTQHMTDSWKSTLHSEIPL